MEKRIDMTPYEEEFTELERRFYYKNSCMNIVKYTNDRNIFTKEQQDKVFNDYLKAAIDYETYHISFENLIQTKIYGKVPKAWQANFLTRELIIND